MSRLLELAAACGILLGAALIVIDVPESAGRQRAHVASLGVFDAGELVGGQRVDHVFRVPNRSGSTWVYKRSKVDCGCVRVVSVTESVLPGRDLVVNVQLDTAGRPLGRTQRTLFVVLEEDGRDVLLQGTVTAHIRNEISVKPPVVRASVRERGSCFQENVEVSVHAASETKPVEYQQFGPFEAAVSGSRLELGRRLYAIEIFGSIDPNCESLSFQFPLELVDSTGETSRVHVPILVERVESQE